jgi:hypothetical protein
LGHCRGGRGLCGGRQNDEILPARLRDITGSKYAQNSTGQTPVFSARRIATSNYRKETTHYVASGAELAFTLFTPKTGLAVCGMSNCARTHTGRGRSRQSA